MPSGCLFLRLGKYPFSKVLPKPSRSMAGPGLGYRDAGDWEPLGLDVKNQLQLGDVIVRERNALTSDLESAGKATQCKDI